MDTAAPLPKPDNPESDCENTSAADSVRKPATAEAAAQEQQKMEALVRFAGGVGHDFNNLLTPIVGYAEMLRSLCAAEERCLRRVQGILEAAAKARDLARQLLTFGRKQSPDLQAIDLNRLLEDFSPTLAQTLRQEIDVIMKLGPSLGNIRADRSQIEQIIMNLALNAQESMPKGGLLSIETANAELSGAPENLPELQPGSYVVLTVGDSGPGMTADALGHIFEPYFSTKGNDRGAGLWLYAVFGIVRQHGGHISASSKEGQGTSFTIYLPRLAEAATTSPEPTAS